MRTPPDFIQLAAPVPNAGSRATKPRYFFAADLPRLAFDAAFAGAFVTAGFLLLRRALPARLVLASLTMVLAFAFAFGLTATGAAATGATTGVTAAGAATTGAGAVTATADFFDFAILLIVILLVAPSGKAIRLPGRIDGSYRVERFANSVNGWLIS